ncbi:MAG TPA: gamma-glutamyltransferase [Acetobacteraceae bacterium]
MASSSGDDIAGNRRNAPCLQPPRVYATVVLVLTLLVSACGGSGGAGGKQSGRTGFIGGVVADEPRAALAGRDVLVAGGNAMDAATAVGLTLAVTLPSRAGLGSGGACLVYAPPRKSPNGGNPEAVLFTPLAPKGAVGEAERPASVPMLARGLFLLHARYGVIPFEALLATPMQLARNGVPVSRALARDLALVSGPLFGDPASRTVFSRDGTPLSEGQVLIQPELGATLAQLQSSGVGDMYQGEMAHRIVQASRLTGGPLRLADLRAALPRLAAPVVQTFGADKLAYLPPPADGGLAAAAAFQVLERDPANLAGASARALAAAVRWRQGGVTPDAVLASADLPQAGLPPLPASTSFATLDRGGNAVVCAVTMDNLFGNGRMLPGLGFIPAASPDSVPAPLLSAALAWNERRQAFHAEVGGSGQNGAPIAVAAGMLNALRTGKPMSTEVPDPGRANAIVCGGYLPDSEKSCGWATDPRGSGLATGAN